MFYAPAIRLPCLHAARARAGYLLHLRFEHRLNEDPAHLADQFSQPLLQAAQHLCHGQCNLHRPFCLRLQRLHAFFVLIRFLQNDSPFFLSEKFPRAYHRLWVESFLFYDLSDILQLMTKAEKNYLPAFLPLTLSFFYRPNASARYCEANSKRLSGSDRLESQSPAR